MATSDAQNLALALGAVPLEPKLPHAEKVDRAHARLAEVIGSDAYKGLALKRQAGLITRDEFEQALEGLIHSDESDS